MNSINFLQGKASQDVPTNTKKNVEIVDIIIQELTISQRTYITCIKKIKRVKRSFLTVRRLQHNSNNCTFFVPQNLML